MPTKTFYVQKSRSKYICRNILMVFLLAKFLSVPQFVINFGSGAACNNSRDISVRKTAGGPC